MARISRARVRGGAERRAPSADRPARAGWAALRQFLFREFFLEIFPATLVSRATRNRTDPLAPPAGRRRHFLNSGWGLVRPPRRQIRWCGRRRRASAARYGVDFDTTPIETALNWGALALARAMGGSERSAEKTRRLPQWRAFPARACEAEPSDALRQQTDPLEPAGRRFANFFFRAVLFRDFPSDVGQQSDPQSDRPAGAACWPPSPLLEFGLGAGAAAAAPDSLVWSAAPGERSEVRGRLRYHPDRNSTELGGACSRSRNGRL